MSDNLDRPSDQVPELSHDAADSLVRSILDNRLSVTEISPSGELLNAIDRFRRNRAEEIAAASNANISISSTSNQASTTAVIAESGPSFAAREDLQEPQDAILARIPRITSTSNTAEARRTRRLIERRRLERHRALAENRQTTMSGSSSALAELHHAGQQLETASQHMRALLDDSQSILTRATAEEYIGDSETSRAAKRRKMDSGISISDLSGFSYGHYGQVEPGKLKMEIESCDGGTYREEYGAGSAAYTAGNVLKNDNSVYCTKGNRCNLVLRHQGATPFSLTELSIKGPHKDFTDPIQQGMVFVSMTYDDRMTRTAQYQIQYPASRNPVRPATRGLESDHIPTSLRHNEDGTITLVDNNGRSRFDIHGSDEHDCRLAQLPFDFTHQNVPPFHITTECCDSDSDSVRPARRRRRAADRLSDRLSAFLSGATDISSDSESSDHERQLQEDYLHGIHHDNQAAASSQHREHHPTGPRMSAGLVEAVTAAHEATQEAFKAVGGILSSGPVSRESGLMAPLAWFFIERDKSKCIIKFDPPVSGRYILLKMWSPHHAVNGNIDIQSVVAKGFAGPRLFPATQTR